MGDDIEERPGPDEPGAPSPDVRGSRPRRSFSGKPEAAPPSGGGPMPAVLAVALAGMIGILYAASTLRGTKPPGVEAAARQPEEGSSLRGLLEAARSKRSLAPQAPPAGTGTPSGEAKISATEQAYALLAAAETSAAGPAAPEGAAPPSPETAAMPAGFDGAGGDSSTRILRLLLYDFEGDHGDRVEVKVDGAVWYRVPLDRKGTIVRVPMPQLRHCEIEIKIVDDHGDGAAFGWESLQPEGMTVPPEVWRNVRRHNQMGGQERVKAGFKKVFTNQVRMGTGAR
jgi:hypothetical protein